MRTALVCGAGGFVGARLVSRLRAGHVWVRQASSLKHPEFSVADANEFVIGDLRDANACREVLDRPFDEVYQLAAEMGGAGYVFSGEHDAEIMANSSAIDANVATAAARAKIGRLFFPSSACVYPAAVQHDAQDAQASEELAYPALPANKYGWQKLYSERVFAAHARAGKFEVRIARFTRYSVRSAPGAEAGRKQSPRSVEKPPKRPTAAPSKSGATAGRRARSCMSTKRLTGSRP